MGNYRKMVGDEAQAALAPKFSSGTFGAAAEDDDRAVVPVKYRIPDSVIGVRGQSQQGHGWRWTG
jgi:hypothetical protein